MTVSESFKTSGDQPCACGQDPSTGKDSPAPLEMLPLYHGPDQEADEPCCGPPAGPASSIHEKPGYAICHFVQEFQSGAVGPVPVVKTQLDFKDYMGTFRVRLGIGRSDYKVAPGLYAVGQPRETSPVLVTANYKLSFDHLRKTLMAVDAWILVLDTRGINVWCAAGKGTFGTDEVVRQVLGARLSEVVDHRKLILPQLGAPGVSALDAKKRCGFEIIWGPVRCQDLPQFLAAQSKAKTGMRRVTFTLTERMVLTPVEIALARSPLIWTLLAIVILSGIGWPFPSLTVWWERSLLAISGCLAGVVAGCFIVPLLLPWIPGRAFAIKGALMGLAAGGIVVAAWYSGAVMGLVSGSAILLLTTAISSFLAMNFTGTTPFTSPSGVEKEMRTAIPLQIAATVIACGLWITAGF